jgi:DHA1 family bicyclomycin/chloramphenicol resistance-like MFS transporter
MAMIRDRYAGADMAREMSFAMTVFILVPVFAPLVGAGVIRVVPWRGAFVVCALFAVGIAVWSLRIPESLAPDRRQPLDVRQVGKAAMAIGRNRKALGYTLAAMPLFGVFSSYLASSERIVGDVFGHASWFPFVFGGTAVVMGASSLVAGKVVNRVGVERLIAVVLVAYTAGCVGLVAVAGSAGGRPGFWPYLLVLVLVLATHNVLFPNLSAAAMQPVGHVAGTAAAIFATASTAVGAVVGSRIDGAFDDTVNPFSRAFLAAAVLACGLVAFDGFRRRATR